MAPPPCRRLSWVGGVAAALALAALVCLPFQLPAQDEEEETRRPFFLPRNPVAAAYVLGRLSNQELIEAPRGEFVYVALLHRQGLERKYRIEAIEGLAGIRDTSPIEELIVTGLAQLDRKGEEAEPVIHELSRVLLAYSADELAERRELLEQLAADAGAPLTRQIAYAAMIAADQSFAPVWQEAESDPERLADLLRSIERVPDPALRTQAYDRVAPLLEEADSPDVLRAAIAAVAALPGHHEQAFRTLAGFVRAETETAAAVESLRRLPKTAWPKENLQPLVESLLKYLDRIPPGERTREAFVSASQLAGELAALLPAETAASIHRTLRELGPSVFLIRAIPEQMLYDRQRIVVETGRPVQIILQNDDAMPHNLVILTPGPVDEIGMAADVMMPEPDSMGRTYVPDSPRVLHATRMLDGGQVERLTFDAPVVPGEYPYVCTYPGHWRRMVGTMVVVEDVEAYPAGEDRPAEPIITAWTVADLEPDLPRVGAGRNLERGRELFTRMGCAQCHRFGDQGIDYGPDLTHLTREEYNNDRAELLRHILEPALHVSERYINHRFDLQDGDIVFGMVVKEDEETVTIQTGPSEFLIQTLDKANIKGREGQAGSLMPAGLLDSLSREEILDLLHYLEFGHATASEAHSHHNHGH